MPGGRPLTRRPRATSRHADAPSGLVTLERVSQVNPGLLNSHAPPSGRKKGARTEGTEDFYWIAAGQPTVPRASVSSVRVLLLRQPAGSNRWGQRLPRDY